MKCVVCNEDIIAYPVDGSRQDDFCSIECFQAGREDK